MIPKGFLADDAASQNPTSQSTSSPISTSKSCSKRYRILTARSGPRDDPFRQAQADASPLIAIPDDEDDVFSTPCARRGYGQRKTGISKRKIEDRKDDDELASMLVNWQAFLTPEKSNRKAAHADLKEVVKESPLGNSKKHKSHLLSTPPIPGKSSNRQAISETSSPKRRSRRATTEPTWKRKRSAADDDSEEDHGRLSLPQTKRTKLSSTPTEPDREEMHKGNGLSSAPATSTKNSTGSTAQRQSISRVTLSKRQDPQTPYANTSGLATPDASSTESPSPGSIKRGVNILSSPHDTNDPEPGAGDATPGTPASSYAIPSSPVTTPSNIKPEKTLSAEGIQLKRKRGAKEAGLSSVRGELKRVRFAKRSALMGKQTVLAKLDPNMEAPRRKSIAAKLDINGTCRSTQLYNKIS